MVTTQPLHFLFHDGMATLFKFSHINTYATDSVVPKIAPPDAPVLPGWWPVPPGWWLLGLAVFLGLLWLGYLFLRRFLLAARARHGRELPVRIQAMAALDELSHRRSLDAREAAYRLNEILRAALFDTGVKKGTISLFRPEESKLSPFLQENVIEDQGAWERFWQELEMRYQPVMPAGKDDVKRWLVLARGWIAHLPVGDVEHDEAKRYLRR